jgi:single-stranded DNA-binding protein
MYVNLNSVTLAGSIGKPPSLSYRRDGMATLRFVLVLQDTNEKLGKVFRTAVPCEQTGAAAERIGADLNEGDIVLVKGRLTYRSTAEEAGGALAVRCQVVQCLEHAAEVPF